MKAQAKPKPKPKKSSKLATIKLADGRILVVPPKGGEVSKTTIRMAVAKVVASRRASRAA